jgi:hypothetical protein
MESMRRAAANERHAFVGCQRYPFEAGGLRSFRSRTPLYKES